MALVGVRAYQVRIQTTGEAILPEVRVFDLWIETTGSESAPMIDGGGIQAAVAVRADLDAVNAAGATIPASLDCVRADVEVGAINAAGAAIAFAVEAGWPAILELQAVE